MNFLNLKLYSQSLPPWQNSLVLQFISITKSSRLIRTSTFPILLSTLNVKPRVASSVPLRECARPNFNPDINRLAPATSRKEDEPPVTDTCQVLSWPRNKASNAMLQLHQQLNKIVEMLAIQRKKSSLTQPQVSLFKVWSINPFKHLSGPMFRESPRLTSSLISNLVFSLTRESSSSFVNPTWSRIQCTSSNPVTNLRVIRQFHPFFFSLLEF